MKKTLFITIFIFFITNNVYAQSIYDAMFSKDAYNYVGDMFRDLCNEVSNDLEPNPYETDADRKNRITDKLENWNGRLYTTELFKNYDANKHELGVHQIMKNIQGRRGPAYNCSYKTNNGGTVTKPKFIEILDEEPFYYGVVSSARFEVDMNVDPATARKYDVLNNNELRLLVEFKSEFNGSKIILIPYYSQFLDKFGNKIWEWGAENMPDYKIPEGY